MFALFGGNSGSGDDDDNDNEGGRDGGGSGNGIGGSICVPLYTSAPQIFNFNILLSYPPRENALYTLFILIFDINLPCIGSCSIISVFHRRIFSCFHFSFFFVSHFVCCMRGVRAFISLGNVRERGNASMNNYNSRIFMLMFS